MELANLLIGQSILLSSLIATITLSESQKCAASLKWLTSLPWIRVTGEKGAVLLLFGLSSLLLIILDFVVSHARLYGLQKLHRRSKSAKTSHAQGIAITFIAFISAYIFQSLGFRVCNLLGISLVVMKVSTILEVIGLQMLKTWLYVVYALCTVLILCFTFIQNAEEYYSKTIGLLRIKF